MVTASDGGNPSRTGFAFVYIRVVRNFNAPTWTNTNFAANILEIQSLHVPLAIDLPGGVRDNDRTAPNNVVSFRMDSSSPAKSQTYFQIGTNGEVSVRQSLTADADTTYTVSRCLMFILMLTQQCYETHIQFSSKCFISI